MAITVAALKANLDTYFGDATTDRISDAERYQFMTEACVWLQEYLGNDHQNVTYDIDYLDTVHSYKITSSVPDLEGVVDLRRAEGKNVPPFTYKSANELAVEIAEFDSNPSFAVERRDKDAFLMINLATSNKAETILSLNSLTEGSGEWEVDAVNSDALNLTVDTIGAFDSACLNFDVDVSQSGNNRATILNTTLASKDLSSFEDLGTWLLRVFVPDVTYFSSVTLFWGTDTSNYWSATVTSEIEGGAFVDGWNRIKINWADATATGTPDASDITYLRIDMNYTGSQLDDTDFRVEDLKITIAERLKFYYTTWYVGKNSSGTDISAFTATTDVPFFSGQYDQYRYAVAHQAAALAFYASRQREEAAVEEAKAQEALKNQAKIFPKSRVAESKSFKPTGVNFRRRDRGRRGR